MGASQRKIAIRNDKNNDKEHQATYEKIQISNPDDHNMNFLLNKDIESQYLNCFPNINAFWVIINKQFKQTQSLEIINGYKKLPNLIRWTQTYSQYNKSHTKKSLVANDVMFGDFEVNIKAPWASTSYSNSDHITYFNNQDEELDRLQNLKLLEQIDNSYFICVQCYKDPISTNIISNKLKQSLIYNLSLLQQDNNIQYDIYDPFTTTYLNPKTKQFDIDIDKGFDLDSDDFSDGDVSLSMDVQWSTVYNLAYNKAFDCITYDTDRNNSAFIHCLIDPNKNCDKYLWISSVFDCNKLKNVKIKDINDNFKVFKVIKSQILNLDYIKYRSLYIDICLIFSKMIPMFENILNRKLGENEKIIIKSSKYVLQKYNDSFKERLRYEGVGEHIDAVGIYYVHIDGIGNDEYLKILTRTMNDYRQFECKLNNLQTGSIIVFNNELFHQFSEIKASKHIISPITRTILSFFIVSPNKSEIKTTNDNDFDLNCNLIYNWIYCINYWIRMDFNQNNKLLIMNLSWMNHLIYLYIFGANYNEHSLKKRETINKQKIDGQVPAKINKLQFHDQLWHSDYSDID